MARIWKFWVLMLVLLLLAAHLNLTALVPLPIGEPQPPWWVGGRLIWPFAEDTDTLLISGNTLDTFTPILGIGSAMFFLLATAALLRWRVPHQWFSWLTIAGVILSVALQVIWFTGWAILPLLVDIVLLWAIFGKRVTVDNLRDR